MDGPGEYAALHGVTLPTHQPQEFYNLALRRFVDLCDAINARATLFVIGRDVTANTAPLLKDLAADGFEIASHSHTHNYRLSQLSLVQIQNELTQSTRAIVEATGKAPQGFRAPGYHLSNTLLDALESHGFVYDSSVFPSPPYYAAKAAVLGAYSVLGKRSSSLLGSPRLSTAPRQPYTPAHHSPYVAGERRLWELPVSVATPLRLPITGASLMLAPMPLRKALAQALSKEAWVIFNFHAMELCEPAELPAGLAAHQPELRLPWPERRRRLMEVLTTIAPGRHTAPLAELVTRNSPRA